MFNWSGARARITSLLTAMTLLISGLFGFASPASAANTSELVLTYTDLQFILKQIQISEEHASVETRDGNGTPILGQVTPRTSVLGTGVNDVPFAGLPWGLRTVDGSLNNLMTGYEKRGAVDQLFPRIAPAQFGSTPNGSSYAPAQSPTTITDTSINNIRITN